MKISHFSLLALLIIASSCHSDDNSSSEQPSSINKIMPLGASRVEGNRPFYESYRFELWKRLVENGWSFDFIGTNTDHFEYPEFDNLPFDRDHEGRSGFTSFQIRDNLEDWLLEGNSPDIVLFSTPGGNDAIQQLPYDNVIQNVRSIIDIFQNDNPNVTIIIEQPTAAKTSIMTEQLTSFFSNMNADLEVIAVEKSTGTSEILLLDIATGFNDSFYADDIHYNQQGAEFVADKYFELLDNILIRSSP